MTNRIEMMKKAQAKVKAAVITKAQKRARAKKVSDAEREDCKVECGRVRQCKVKEYEERPCGRFDDNENPVQFSVPRLTMEEEHARMMAMCEHFQERAMNVVPKLKDAEFFQLRFKTREEGTFIRRYDEKKMFDFENTYFIGEDEFRREVLKRVAREELSTKNL